MRAPKPLEFSHFQICSMLNQQKTFACTLQAGGEPVWINLYKKGIKMALMNSLSSAKDCQQHPRAGKACDNAGLQKMFKPSRMLCQRLLMLVCLMRHYLRSLFCCFNRKNGDKCTGVIIVNHKFCLSIRG